MVRSMAITPARQRNAVSEGIALGLLVLGRQSLPYDKIRVDLSFAGAWRGWQYRSLFPKVSTDLQNRIDGIWVMTHATASKQVYVLFWEVDHELYIAPRRTDWSPADPEDLAYAVDMIGTEVPLDGWVSLAKTFLDRLDPSPNAQ